jgi:ABC-type transporter Mla subunit MlaD
MSARTHNFRIGLFVLTGAGLFVAALFALGLETYFGKRDLFETFVTGKVESLSVGALVKLRGVTIGKVTSIDFIGTEYPGYNQQFVVIQFQVPQGAVWGPQGNLQEVLDREIAQGLRARVQTQGFVGASFLALEYVDPQVYSAPTIPWTPRHYYIPSAPSQFNRVLESLEKSLRHAEELDLAGLFDRANKLLDAASRVAANVDEVDFKQLGTNALSLVGDVRETNRGLQQTLADARSAINGADLPGVSRQTAALEAKLSSAALELRRVLAAVDTGELNNSLANVRAATDELLILLHHLEQRPSSVLFSKSPHPLPELEKPPRK